jgi:hypothetical protein
MNYRFTEADAEEGRQLLRACFEQEGRDAKAELFYDWMNGQLGISRSVVKEKFPRYFEHDHNAAMRILDKVIAGHNPVESMVMKSIAFALVAFVALGLLGGVVYLFRSC